MKKKLNRGAKFKITLTNVIKYLKTDSYMYSPLLTYKPEDATTFTSRKGVIGTTRAVRKKKFLHKVLDYLKSDSYMYAPLIASQTGLTKASEEQSRATKTTLSSSTHVEKQRSKKNSQVRRTLAYRAVEKRLISSVCRPSSVSGA